MKIPLMICLELGLELSIYWSDELNAAMGWRDLKGPKPKSPDYQSPSYAHAQDVCSEGK